MVFNGYYSTSTRDSFITDALDPAGVKAWKIIPRHNPASDYPSDFSLVKVLESRICCTYMYTVLYPLKYRPKYKYSWTPMI